MTPEEQRIREEAIEFANRNKKVIARELTNKYDFPPDAEPVSIFMAGSPGAGKTEASKALIREVGGTPIVRIDPDDLRSRFEGYDGQNSWLFQPATVILVERIHDSVVKNGQSFILDGALFSLGKARSNVKRSLKRR
jgi:predicted ABC-type ATPase